jgi:hypothetical protein
MAILRWILLLSLTITYIDNIISLNTLNALMHLMCLNRSGGP